MNDKRPDFLNCPMTPEIIRRIRESQDAWDKKHPDQIKEDK